MADDRQVNEVIINGETVVNLRKDTVAENNLMEEETATNHEGRKIEGEFNGASEDDAYLVSDPIGDIEEEDYVPFNDVSDTEIPKKKTLFSEFIEKLKDYFMSIKSSGGNSEIQLTNDTFELKNNTIDASKVDNNVTSIRYPSSSVILDGKGRCIMRTEAVVNPNGEIGWKSYVRNYDTDGQLIVQKGMRYHMDKSGNLYYVVDDARAFRKAIDTIDQLGTSLPRNTVIDDYHTDSYTGTYYFGDDGVASTIVTLPEAVCGKLIVTNNGNGGFSQYYIPNHSVKIWVRVWWSNAWSAWQNVASGSKPHTYESGQNIPENADLNDYKTEGVYTTVSDTIVATLSNTPTDKAGQLIVSKIVPSGNYQMQYYITTMGEMYTRIYNNWNTSWSNWENVASGVHTYETGTKIPKNADLNTYTTEGTYYVDANVAAASISNMPCDKSGKLIVLKMDTGARVDQMYITNYQSGAYHGLDDDIYMYIRQIGNDGVAHPWREIGGTDDYHYLSEPNTAHQITANQDLNDYVNSGTYQCNNSNIATTLSNCPVSVSFKLVVDRQYSDSRSELTQRITCLNSSGVQGGEWYRTKTYNVSTWGEWIHVVFASNNVNGNKNGLQIYPTVSNGTRGVLKWNDADDTHLTHDFHDGTGWAGSKTLANIDDITPIQVGNGYAEGTVNGSAITATMTGFQLRTGVVVSIKIPTEVSVDSTLNINSTGAKYIKYWANETITFGKPLKGGAVYTFIYDGTYYRVISFDRTCGISTQSYVADTSGNVMLDWGYGVNRAQLKYDIGSNKLRWNYYKNSTWRGDRTLLDVDNGIETNRNVSVNSLDDIPVNTAGRVVFSDLTQAPISTMGDYAYICYGYVSGNQTRKVVELTRTSHGSKNSEEKWYNANNGTSWTGWMPLSRTGTYVGTCTTAADQQIKIATVDDDFSLKKGVRIAIKYTNSNTYNATASAPCKLNVNNTGDKQIYYYNTSTPTGTNNNAFGAASKYVYYIYDGTYWVWDGHGVDSNTDIRPSAYCDTASATAAKVASCTEYQLLSNSYLHILMRYSNTSASAITLNVNNKGAKPIYINGTASSSSNYTLPAGTYIVFYDGTNYYFRTDGNIMTNDNLRFFKQQSNLFFNTSYVSDTSGNYGLNIAPVADKNDRAQLKVSGTYQSALFYNYCINGTWKGDGLIFNKWFPNIVYCTSSTEAGTAAKVATSQGGGKLVILLVGMVACVVHSNNNTASNCTLNIDGTGAKQIYYNQGVYTGTSDIVCGRQNMAIFYMYDGTYWRWLAHGRNDNSTNFLRNDASSTLTASGSAYLDVKSSTIDLKQANNGVESTQYPAYIIQDKNGYTMSRLECVVETDGGVSTYLQVRNYKSDGTNPNAGIRVKMDKNGTLQYFISQSNKFNAAIGIGYGTCTTAADQRVKIVNITDYVITTGGIIGVKFSNTNTYSATADNKICLNVNGTGEKPIYYNTGYSTGTNTTAFGIANRVHYYMYDGTNWCWLNSGCEDNTVDPRQLGSGYGTCDTAAATAAKVVTMSSYALRTGGILSVKFTNAVPANATMNINSRGAKSIYYRGSAIPANIIRAGDRCLFVYNGSQYDLLSVDRDSIEKNNVIAWSDIAFGTNVPSMSSANSNVWGDIRSNLLLANMRFSTSASGTIPANNSSSGGFFRISKFAPYTWRMVHVTYGNTYVPAYLDNITYNGTSGLMVVLRNSLSVAQNADICVSFEVELE